MPDQGIILENIGFSYESGGRDEQSAEAVSVPVFRDFSIGFRASGVSVILGPSGCGKTTLLNLICGLLRPDSGSIRRKPDTDRNSAISLLFQEPRLLPWRTVRQNIEIVLKKTHGSESGETAKRYLELVGLSGYSEYYPGQLSGGMRQRVAVARAFAYPADTILMDEPFQALDLRLKMNLTRLFTDLWVRDRRTAIFVTHDIGEAILLGDEIFVLSSDRPVRIVDRIENHEPHSERRLDSPESLRTERFLYRLLS